MVDFTRNFTDGCHHAKEEKLLFPLLEERDAAAGGPVSVTDFERVEIEETGAGVHERYHAMAHELQAAPSDE